ERQPLTGLNTARQLWRGYEQLRGQNGWQTSWLRTRSTQLHSKRTTGFYRMIMFGDSPLSRAEREAIAVAVSAANDCFY
ncbi:MAG TPA: carboxymuconolactone decarboxylase family protein, partial [Gaiellaceae bacterium]|nr:carboxymuconolactone decarboxylase family protein [Gaiellaceae bacterium]